MGIGNCVSSRGHNICINLPHPRLGDTEDEEPDKMQWPEAREGPCDMLSSDTCECGTHELTHTHTGHLPSIKLARIPPWMAEELPRPTFGKADVSS